MRKTIATITAVVCLLSGCTSFLDVRNLGKSTIDGFFSDTDGLRAAGYGLHRTILEFYDDDILRYADIAADNTNVIRVNAGETVLKIFDFDNLPEDTGGFPRNIWKQGYSICTNANNILFYGDNLLRKYPAEEQLVKEHFGYAYFARALAIFQLTNIYAQAYSYTSDASHLGVVAIDRVPSFEEHLARNTVSECYKLVEADLLAGIECFGGDDCPDPNLISGLACEALLARVYLYNGEYDKAAEYASKVMEKKKLTPRADYVKMFRKAQEEPGEGILRMNSYNAGSGMRSLLRPTSKPVAVPTAEFIASFGSDDVRKELFTYIAETADGEEYAGKEYTSCCKYLPIQDGVADELNRRSDPMVLRVSEMYLIHAEALCELGKLPEAAADVEAIRSRATGSKEVVSYSDAKDLARQIQEERAKELYMEGHRFFDLKRRGESIIRPASTTSLTKSLTYPDHRFTMPIDQTEMEANGSMEQNEGY